jgi:hypothetical protein
LDHAIQDARTERSGQRRIVSKRMQFVELGGDGNTKSAGPAPYLDYRPLEDDELQLVDRIPEPAWLRTEVESRAQEHAAVHLVPEHLEEVRGRKSELIDKTLAAVKERLTKEINYWDHRAEQLKEQELAGKKLARLNSGIARQRADDLMGRLKKRTEELEQERKLSPLPPVVLGGALVVPIGLLKKLSGQETATPLFARETERSEKLAMDAVMEAESQLGNEPRDVSAQKLGYDIESSVPGTGRLRFIEVKGRVAEAETVTITKNEILTAFNKPDDFILAIGVVNGEDVDLRYVRHPFQREPDFGVTSVNYNLTDLFDRGGTPE